MVGVMSWDAVAQWWRSGGVGVVARLERTLWPGLVFLGGIG